MRNREGAPFTKGQKVRSKTNDHFGPMNVRDCWLQETASCGTYWRVAAGMGRTGCFEADHKEFEIVETTDG